MLIATLPGQSSFLTVSAISSVSSNNTLELLLLWSGTWSIFPLKWGSLKRKLLESQNSFIQYQTSSASLGSETSHPLARIIIYFFKKWTVWKLTSLIVVCTAFFMHNSGCFLDKHSHEADEVWTMIQLRPLILFWPHYLKGTYKEAKQLFWSTFRDWNSRICWSPFPLSLSPKIFK